MMIAVNVVGAPMTNLANGAGEDVPREWRHAILNGYSAIMLLFALKVIEFGSNLVSCLHLPADIHLYYLYTKK